ncbi:hypothetical protein HX824_10520 [Pseudomonas sp. D4002]|uniref:5'-methylthioadenosine/S-adenosylhomocysteine nucleosidase family protein n=1 Tax=Pseudomonas sp. D4002 TaxID=2738817 RepID=UPI0015A11280|nr:hypothetical protein [Pseudomonas sp. D4002]NWB21034.1 hypothetical protein [Pseudomonas sp. D4002]
MKILIADDHPARYEPLLEEIKSIDINIAKNITFVVCADDAASELESTYYDLLILDIILPLHNYNQATSHTYSLDLLHRIHMDEEIQKPGKVIGITSDKAAAHAASDKFDENTWAIVNYSPQSDTWMNRIANCIRYLNTNRDTQPLETNQTTIDLAIICALEDPELEEILKLPWNWQASRPIDDSVFVNDGWLMLGGKKITIAATFATRMGMISTAIKSLLVINSLRPKLLVMTGICAGVRGKADLGDVLFADPAWDFQSGKRVIDAGTRKFSIAPHQLPADHRVRSHFEQLRSDRAFFSELPKMFAADCKFKTTLRIGPVASGSAVLADGITIEEIKDQQRDLLGVEMEIYGLYAAAFSTSGVQPKTFAIKGVCDFADPDKRDEAQSYAAFASAKVLERFINRYGNRFFG